MKNGTDLYNLILKYNLSNNAVVDTSLGAKILYQKVKATIIKYAINKTGKVLRRWLKLLT